MTGGGWRPVAAVHRDRRDNRFVEWTGLPAPWNTAPAVLLGLCGWYIGIGFRQERTSVGDQTPEHPNTFKVFDRERDHHPWQGAFQELQRPDEERRWAVAANWRMDHRVSEDREKGDLDASGHFGSVTDASSWWDALSLYFQAEICRSDNPPSEEKQSACYRETNRDNRISARIPELDELVHIGSLNGMVRWILTPTEGYADVDRGLREILGRGLPPKPLS